MNLEFCNRNKVKKWSIYPVPALNVTLLTIWALHEGQALKKIKKTNERKFVVYSNFGNDSFCLKIESYSYSEVNLTTEVRQPAAVQKLLVVDFAVDCCTPFFFFNF